MENNDLDNKKSLVKDMAKKGISKIIKKLPLKYKLIIIGVIAAIILSLLTFVLLSIPIIMLLFDDSEGNDDKTSSDMVYTETTSVDNYWWPVGGKDITKIDGKDFALGTPSTTNITSDYTPKRTLYYDSDGDGKNEPHTSSHYAIDISWQGTHYIISIAPGVVTNVVTGCANNGSLSNRCNGGYGNYITIEHSGGVYSTYAHLNPNGIKVKKGDIVKQGQVLGIMGNSGKSTGQHLHFEMKVSESKVNPLDYISASTPRPITVISGTEDFENNNTGGTGSGSSLPQTQQQIQLLQMLHSWEGTGPTSGDYYIVYADSGGVLTVGHGVTLIYNASEFSERGIDSSKLFQGSKVKKSIVDDIERELLIKKRDSILSLLKNNNISLKDYQVDALVSRMYNVGNVGGFPDKYKQHGNSQALYDNYMNRPITDANGTYLLGLERRRQAEWKLFTSGIYTFNS